MKDLAHYRVVKPIGSGGGGDVYEAFDSKLNRSVALKLVHGDRGALDEARAASALDHPNILTVHDVGVADGRAFLVSELVRGETLRERLASGRLSHAESVAIAIQIASGLRAAHAAGIVHRDLKPENVMLAEDGTVKILDFGIAASAASDVDTETATRESAASVSGSAGYMAPEQANGERADARADIFALGSMLYEMLTGARAFGGDTEAARLTATLRDEPSPIRGIAAELQGVVTRALRKDPERRFQAVADLRVSLLEIGEQRATHARTWTWLLVGAALGATVATLLLARGRDTVDLRPQPITSLSGHERAPVLSPDGTMIAFVWHGPDDSGQELYVQRIGSGGPLKLTSAGSRVRSPTWSPDGSEIAFAYAGRGPIMVAPALGGEIRRVGATGRPQLDWMPDGAGIIAIAESGKGEDVIALVDLDDASSQPLTMPNDHPHPVGHYSVSVSPDASQVAFVRTGGGPMELCVAPITGGAPQCLFEPPSGRIRGVDWSPDGSEIVFAVDPGPWTHQGLRGLWRIPSDGGEPVRVVGADGEVSDPTISNDGKLAYRRELHDVNIWRVDGPTAENPGATRTRVVDSTRIDQEPSVSPDGTRLAFASNRNGQHQIWVADADGANSIQLTFDDQTAQRPRWSPDGNWIVFEDFDDNGNIHLAVIEASGGIPRKLTQSDEFADFLPSFSRDGRFVYFASNRFIPDAAPPFSVYRVPFDGGDPELVSRSNTNMVVPSLTNDELFIYRRGEIWRDGDARVLFDKAQWPLWDVFEDGICYHRNAPGDPIECYRFSTGEIQRIIDFGATYGRGLAVSPDGRWIYYTVDELDSSDILMIDGLF